MTNERLSQYVLINDKIRKTYSGVTLVNAVSTVYSSMRIKKI